MSDLRIEEDRSGSGRITQVFVDGAYVWSWAWHIDGPPSEETMSLLRALGVRE